MDGAEHISMHKLGMFKKEKKPRKSKESGIKCVPKEELPRGYYFLRKFD